MSSVKSLLVGRAVGEKGKKRGDRTARPAEKSGLTKTALLQQPPLFPFAALAPCF